MSEGSALPGRVMGSRSVMNVAAHIVVPDADAASAWYQQACEFPAAGILSPLSIGGTATVLQINTDDAGALWQQAVPPGEIAGAAAAVCGGAGG